LGGDAEFGKEFSGLKFVDIHGKKWISPTNTQHPLKGKELPFKGCKNLNAAAPSRFANFMPCHVSTLSQVAFLSSSEFGFNLAMRPVPGCNLGLDFF
jgi:hypothetical protein